MPNWGYWTLVASVLVALIIMLVAYLITRLKITKIRDEFLLKDEPEINTSKALERGEEAGQLLWDLKEKAKNPLNDLVLEYTINTIIRNEYKRVSIIGGSEYESKSLIKIAGIEIVDHKMDFILMIDHENLNENFDKIFPNLRAGGMLSIVGIKKKEPQAKRLISYLKTTGIRYDFLKVSKGIILVAK